MKVIIVLFVIVAISAGEIININDEVDKGLVAANALLLKYNITDIHYKPPGGKNAGTFLGIDSWVRTDDCFVDVNETVAKLEYHLGLRMLSYFMPSFTMGGDTMTALTYFGYNSAVIKGTFIKTPTVCNITVDVLAIEKLENIWNYASLPDFDKKDVTEHVRQKLLPIINDMLDKVRPYWSEMLTEYNCKKPYTPENFSRIDFLPLLELIKNKSIQQYIDV